MPDISPPLMSTGPPVPNRRERPSNQGRPKRMHQDERSPGPVITVKERRPDALGRVPASDARDWLSAASTMQPTPGACLQSLCRRLLRWLMRTIARLRRRPGLTEACLVRLSVPLGAPLQSTCLLGGKPQSLGLLSHVVTRQTH